MEQNPSNAPDRAGFTTSGAMSSQTDDMAARAQSTADTAREKLNEAGDQARDKLDQVRERAGHLKSTLADKLDAGASKLRQRDPASAAADRAGVENESARSNMRQVETRVASGMESTADWLRSADMDQFRSGVENQVRTNPGRTLLIALGLGYLLGRALRGGGEG